MNDLNKQAAKTQIDAQAIGEFNGQTESNLVLIREFCEDLLLRKSSQSVAVCLAAALVAAEVAAASGSVSGRSLQEVMELLGSLFYDMQSHAKRTFEVYQDAQTDVAVEDVAFREAVTND